MQLHVGILCAILYRIVTSSYSQITDNKDFFFFFFFFLGGGGEAHPIHELYFPLQVLVYLLLHVLYVCLSMDNMNGI